MKEGKEHIAAPDLALNVKTERDTNLLSGEEFVRVFYRRNGARRWEKVAVFRTDDQMLEDIEANAYEIAERMMGLG